MVETLVTVLLNGLTFSMLLFLVAAGLSLVFGLMDVVNFAHGAFYMLGTYFGLRLSMEIGFFPALVIAPALVMILAMIIEVLTLRPIYEDDHVLQLLLTFGLALIVEELVVIIEGPTTHFFPPPEVSNGQVSLLGIEYPTYRLVVMIAGAMIGVALYLFLLKTRYGLITRAGMMNKKMVETNGINIDRVYTVMFGIGGLLAGIAGVMAGPLFNAYPAMGLEMIIQAFVVVVIGGLGSIAGSVLGALAIGMGQSVGDFYFPELSGYMMFLLLVTVLLIKPEGLLGKGTGGGDL